MTPPLDDMDAARKVVKVIHGKDSKWYVCWKGFDIDYPHPTEQSATHTCDKFQKLLAAHVRAVVEEKEAETECWESGHTQDILMADGSVETRRLPKTHCPSCVDKAIDALRAALAERTEERDRAMSQLLSSRIEPCRVHVQRTQGCVMCLYDELKALRAELDRLRQGIREAKLSEAYQELDVLKGEAERGRDA